MLSIRRRLQLVLPGEPLAAVQMPSGDLVVACARQGEVLVARFEAGSRSDEPRRSERLLRVPSASPERGEISLFSPPTGREHPVLVSRKVVMGIDARSMEPRWRFNLDDDGGGRAVQTRTRLLVADPPGRVTALNWEGHEGRSYALDADALALCDGPTPLAVTRTGAVWALSDVPSLLHQLPPVARAQVQVDRHGGVHVLADETLHRFDVDGARSTGATGGASLAVQPDATALVGTPVGVVISERARTRRVADFVAVSLLVSLASGVAVAATPRNLLTIHGARVEMLAFHGPSVIVPTPLGAWVIAEDGQAVWAV
jgi:hypothetical protein